MTDRERRFDAQPDHDYHGRTHHHDPGGAAARAVDRRREYPDHLDLDEVGRRAGPPRVGTTPSQNEPIAARLRGEFQARGLGVVNLLSSAGSGKTTLLARTLSALAPGLRAGVIVGDLATDLDARRLREAGAPVVQVNTGGSCHLDAAMIVRALAELDLAAGARGLDLLFIENLGNLACPAAYDLGESRRVVMLSVTEGEDKPLKYPLAFRGAHAVVLSKLDLAGPAGFDRATALENLRRIAPDARVFELSARTGEGLDAWQQYLLDARLARAGAI